MVFFGTVLCLLAAAALIILFAPFVFSTRFSTRSHGRNGIFQVHWLHPWVAFVKYSIPDKAVEFRLFGRNMKGAAAGAGVDDRPGPVKTKEMVVPPPKKNVEPQHARKEEYVRPADTKKTDAAPTVRQYDPPSGNDADPGAPPAEASRFSWARLKKTIVILRRGRSGRKILRWGIRVVRFSLRIIRFDHLRIYTEAGLQDPAYTGKIFGYFTAMRSALVSGQKNFDIRLEPRFMRNVFELEGSAGVRTSVAAVMTPLVVALFTFPYITVFIVWRRLKKVYTISGSVSEAKE